MWAACPRTAWPAKGLGHPAGGWGTAGAPARLGCVLCRTQDIVHVRGHRIKSMDGRLASHTAQTANLQGQKSAEKLSACASKVSSYFKKIIRKGEELRCTTSEAAFSNCFERHDFLDQMTVIVH